MPPFHHRLLAVVSLAALGFVAFSGCGGSESPSPDTTRGATATGTAEGEAPAAAEIDQDNLAFKPNAITVAAGGILTFKNSETAFHTVTINGKNESATMKKGELFLWSPPAAGSYKVTCDFHPQMRATVTVR